jgi:hypothetical protein
MKWLHDFRNHFAQGFGAGIGFGFTAGCWLLAINVLKWWLS